MARDRRSYNHSYYLAHQDRAKTAAKANYNANRERHHATTRAWRELHPYYAQARRFGLTEARLETMLLESCGKCYICCTVFDEPQKHGSPRAMHVDHDHTTGKVRGLLCHQCNNGLALMHDDPRVLSEAATYLADAA